MYVLSASVPVSAICYLRFIGAFIPYLPNLFEACDVFHRVSE